MYTLYCTLFLPYLNYCVEIWGNNFAKNIKGIILLQKRALRTIGNVSFRAHTNPLFNRYKVVKFLDLVKIRTCAIVYRAKHDLLPVNLLKLLKLENNEHYYTKNSNSFLLKYARTNVKKRCISVLGIKLFNGVDISITNSKTVKEFVRKFKCKLRTDYSLLW